MSDLNRNSASDDPLAHYSGPEIWRTPPDCPPYYECSTHGGWRTKLWADRGRGRWKTIVLKHWDTKYPAVCGSGYPTVTYCDVHGHIRTRALHTVIMETFVGPMPAGMHLVRHLDDIKTHNYLANLAYGTHRENAQDHQRNKARLQSRMNQHHVVP